MAAFGFYPKILGGGGDLQIVVLLKKECSFNGADNVRWWDTQTLLEVKKIELSQTGSGDAKTF